MKACKMKTLRDRPAGSFERSRRALLTSMVARARGKATEQVIPFSNNDVPNFLRALDKFEARSRNVALVVK